MFSSKLPNYQIKLDIVDLESTEYGGYDQSNALVLPSEKRNTKIKKDKDSNVTRILSKKQRKNLEKIVDKKKKKEGVSKYRTNQQQKILLFSIC